MTEQDTTIECLGCGAEIEPDDETLEQDTYGNAWHVDCYTEQAEWIGGRGMALLEFVQVDDPDITPWAVEESGIFWTCQGSEYLVLVDDEADEEAKKYAQNYVDEIILPQIPEHLKYYFDSERWIADAFREGGRESFIPSAGNYEDSHDCQWDGQTYYIYRQ